MGAFIQGFTSAADPHVNLLCDIDIDARILLSLTVPDESRSRTIVCDPSASGAPYGFSVWVIAFS